MLLTKDENSHRLAKVYGEEPANGTSPQLKSSTPESTESLEARVRQALAILETELKKSKATLARSKQTLAEAKQMRTRCLNTHKCLFGKFKTVGMTANKYIPAILFLVIFLALIGCQNGGANTEIQSWSVRFDSTGRFLCGQPKCYFSSQVRVLVRTNWFVYVNGNLDAIEYFDWTAFESEKGPAVGRAFLRYGQRVTQIAIKNRRPEEIAATLVHEAGHHEFSAKYGWGFDAESEEYARNVQQQFLHDLAGCSHPKTSLYVSRHQFRSHQKNGGTYQ